MDAFIHPNIAIYNQSEIQLSSKEINSGKDTQVSDGVYLSSKNNHADPQRMIRRNGVSMTFRDPYSYRGF
jgi:hypothetical protein